MSTKKHEIAGTQAAGGGIALRNAISLSVNDKGYLVIDSSSTICGDDDFVGVYQNQSLPQGDNLGGVKGWQWCSHSMPYNTSVQAEVGIVAIYWSKNYKTGNYERVCYTPSLPNTKPYTTVNGATS